MELVCYQIEKEKIEARIRDLQSQLKGKRGSSPAASTNGDGRRGKRELSAAARARIAAAQKKRWAEHRKRQAQAAKSAKVQAAG